jgi:phenylpropionate dioxygenase-like ring-hydroxylating dioxygenase large terminal subunit
VERELNLDFGPATSSVAEAWTLPATLYTDPRVFTLERARVFARSWIAVGRSDQLPPGGFLAHEIAGDPIVVTRDESGRLHSFSNVCLHRACPIATGRGIAAHGLLTCPYHRWNYGLDGRLRGAPLMERAHGFDKSSLALPALAVEEWLGWIFVNADPDAAALAPQLAGLHALLAPFDVAEMVVCRTISFDSRWNWKVMVENFMESYHHIGAHPETLNASHPAAGTFAVDVPGPFSLLENPAKEGSGAPFWVMCVFPDLLFALTRGEVPTGFWYQMHHHAHDHFTLEIHLMAQRPLADDPGFTEQYARIATAIHLEDIPMCEGVWKGLNSRFVRDGRLSHLEAANWKFHRWLRERLDA